MPHEDDSRHGAEAVSTITDDPSTSRRAVMKRAAAVGAAVGGFGLGASSAGASAGPAQYPRTDAAPEWTNLFDRDSGWLGADGIYSLPLDGNDAPVPSGRGGETLFVFSDSLIELGDPSDGEWDDFTIVNNTLAVMDGSDPERASIEFFWRETDSGDPRAVFVPEAEDEGDWYWMGDGFVNHALDDTIYLFGLQFRDDPDGVFPIHVETDMFVLSPDSEPPYEDYRRVETPLLLPATEDRGRRTFTSSVMPNTAAAGASNPDGYVYVYGIEELVQPKQLLVARVRPEDFESFDEWEYWDGDRWAADPESAAGVTTRISNELSVTPLANGTYRLTFQRDTNSRYTAVRHGDSPVGPWGPIEEVWEAPEPGEDNDYYAYNAKAHPHLSRGRGSMLMSYNVNTNAFFEDFDDYPNFYFPRFVRYRGQ